MKTLFIYIDGDKFLPNFFILDGDFKHLDKTLINGDDEDKEKELAELIYENKTGKTKVKLLEDFPLDQKFDFVISCGFLP